VRRDAIAPRRHADVGTVEVIQSSARSLPKGSAQLQHLQWFLDRAFVLVPLQAVGCQIPHVNEGFFTEPIARFI
jgi:hypothetical protein